MLQKYEKYKDSGVEWIGEIPEGWEVKRLKYVGEALIGITYSPSEVTTENCGTLVLRSSNVQNGELAFDDCVYVDKKIQEKDYTKEGDILICARNGSAHLVGKCAYVDRANAGHTFGAFMSIVRSQCGRYLYHFFSSEIFKSQTGLFSTSTINQLTSDTLNNLRIAFPNVIDQASITSFLDRKTAEIDQLIANKEKLVALYEEEKTAIINRAVTRGLDSAVKTKPSGVDWLGDIPKHWEVKRLKYVLKVNSGDGIKSDDIKPYGLYPVYGGNGIVGYTDVFNSENDVIIIGRVGAKCGNVRLVGGKKYISDNALVANLINSYNFKYVSILMESLDLNKMANQNAQPLITGTMVKEKHCVFPPLTEQTAIVTHIETECARLDTIIDKFKKQIELFKEYRTTLISDVVTGKIDVRGEVQA
jgi:type I restriction enzyme S subunit